MIEEIPLTIGNQLKSFWNF